MDILNRRRNIVRHKLQKPKEIERVEMAGSYGRKKEIVGDIGVLEVSKKPKQATDFFCFNAECYSCACLRIDKIGHKIKN